MRRLRLTTEDLFEQLRQKGVFYLEDVAWAIVETNGMLSVIRRPEDPVMAISTVLGWTSVSISLGVKENSIPRSLAIEKESGIRLSSVENPIMPPKRARSVCAAGCKSGAWGRSRYS